jgi:hypothetical protein
MKTDRLSSAFIRSLYRWFARINADKIGITNLHFDQPKRREESRRGRHECLRHGAEYRHPACRVGNQTGVLSGTS